MGTFQRYNNLVIEKDKGLEPYSMINKEPCSFTLLSSENFVTALIGKSNCSLGNTLRNTELLCLHEDTGNFGKMEDHTLSNFLTCHFN